MAVVIDRKQLFAEMSVAEPILKKEAERVMRESFFLPAVKELNDEFDNHPVTQEIKEGISASNISNTLQGDFSVKGENLSPPNLTSFIGFDASDGDPLVPIKESLDPNHPNGPKLSYVNKDKDNLTFNFKISAPNQEEIYRKTPMPWAKGISWAKRIEVGIAGVGYFLNVNNAKGSRSGGGIQVQKQIRSGRYKAVPYISRLFNDFLSKFRSHFD